MKWICRSSGSTFQLTIHSQKFICNLNLLAMSKSKINYRTKVFCHTLWARLKEECSAFHFLLIAFIYALVSNILYKCEPLPIDASILSIMDSVDEVIRNFCYGIGASVCFYLFHDVIRGHRKTVDTYNEMFEELHKLWWSIRSPLMILCDDIFKYPQDKESLVQRLYLRFCKTKKENRTYTSVTKLPISDVHFLLNTWTNVMTEKKKFLEVFGNVISREEFLKINNSEYDDCWQRLKGIMPEVEIFEKGQVINMRDYDILMTSRLMLEFQSDLAKMVNKYSIYDYSDSKYKKKMP
jgi:hypothetical protein